MYISQLKLINNLLSSSWWHALLFGTFIDCVIILSIRETSFLVSSRIVFEAAFVIFSEILFQTKSCFDGTFWGSFECIRCWRFCAVKKLFFYTYCSDVYPCILQRMKIQSLWHKFDLWGQLNILLCTFIINN